LINGLVTFFGNLRILGCTDGSIGPYKGPSLQIVHHNMGVDDHAFNFFNMMMLNVMRNSGVSPADLLTVTRLLNATRSEIVGV
jgi:hypothetical protein